jgi:hypothetical protein
MVFLCSCSWHGQNAWSRRQLRRESITDKGTEQDPKSEPRREGERSVRGGGQSIPSLMF